jgi:hypothetical protein
LVPELGPLHSWDNSSVCSGEPWVSSVDRASTTLHVGRGQHECTQHFQRLEVVRTAIGMSVGASRWNKPAQMWHLSLTCSLPGERENAITIHPKRPYKTPYCKEMELRLGT